MNSRDAICDIAILRDIGFNDWDPIGLRDVRESCEDEYDSYLVQAIGLALRGEPADSISNYLMNCCGEMGVVPSEAAAAITAAAIVHAVTHARRSGS